MRTSFLLLRVERYARTMYSWEITARESIRETMAAYNYAGDRGRLRDLATAFSPDGALQIGSEDAVVGPDAIVDRLSEAIQLDPVPKFVHHHVTGLHIRSASPDLITSASYFQVLTDAGLDHWGRYADTFVPIGDRWLFSHRRISADAFAQTSCFKR